MSESFVPIRPRVSEAVFGGCEGVVIDLPGRRGRGIFIPRTALDNVIDALDTIAERYQS